MDPQLTRFESEQPNVKYTHVNVDEKDKPPGKELFDKYFQGQSIPYTVLIDDKGEAKKMWTGMKTYPELVQEIQELESGGK